jgi:hypothetical protein
MNVGRSDDRLSEGWSSPGSFHGGCVVSALSHDRLVNDGESRAAVNVLLWLQHLTSVRVDKGGYISPAA